MITNFLKFINEELSIDKLDPNTLEDTKDNIVFRLNEFRDSILSNIKYDTKTNKIEFINFEDIQVDTMLNSLKNEFTKEVIDDLNIESFFRKIQQILELKQRNTKKQIRDEFVEYYISLDNRIKKITAGEVEDKSRLYDEEDDQDKSLINKKTFETEKYDIQVELLKMQEWVMKNNKRVAIVFEGRDAAGKGSAIKRFTEYLIPKGFRTVALGVPTDEEKEHWFERYEKQLPKNGEIVFFDRSWYNRAVVEPALGYCTEDQYMDFMENVTDWEENLIKGGLILIKLWFSITKDKQLLRFELRKNSPLKYWKFSPNDAKVVDKWDIITKYKNQMFNNTSSPKTPWIVINSNDKRIGMLNAMRYVLWEIDYDGKNEAISEWYPEVVNIIK